jgi:DNA-binding HxlR family transcriptional regulator
MSGSPINALFDLLGRRWALGILWQLDEPRSFRGLQALCGGVSPSILNARLKDLREAGIVIRSDTGYELSMRGRELRSLIVPLGAWSADWSSELFGVERPGMRERLAAGDLDTGPV